LVHGTTEAFTRGNTQLTVTATTIKKVYAFAETMNLVSLEVPVLQKFRSFTPHRRQPTLKNNKPNLHKITKQAFKLSMALRASFPWCLYCDLLAFLLTNNSNSLRSRMKRMEELLVKILSSTRHWKNDIKFFIVIFKIAQSVYLAASTAP
jgi:hypothetical protein